MTESAAWTNEQLEIYQFLTQPDNHYLHVKRLEDGSFACIHDLIYTRAIMIDCDKNGYDRRYCFEDRNLALTEFDKLKSCDDVPTGHIAERRR